jgi:suppressor of ftsI
MENRQLPHLAAMSRRRFLGLGAGALGVFGLGSAAHSTPSSPAFFEPQVRSSANGFLTTTLRASTGPTVVAGQSVIGSTYEGTFPGPTLKVRPGDFLQIELINDLQEETNLHLHGMHVTPQTPGDNVLIHIPPGQRFTYQYFIPLDHPGGTFFYHPHLHGTVTNQLFKGMTGLLIVEGDIDALPGIAGLTEQSLILQRVSIVNGQIPTINSKSGSKGNLLVNGASQPTLFIRPGETQRWRFLNTTVATLSTVQVEGHQLTLIAQDGNTVAQPQPFSSIPLATAQRRDVLIQGGPPGTYALTFTDLQGPGPVTPQQFATLVVTGTPLAPQPMPTFLLPVEDLRLVPVARQRTITFNAIGSFNSNTFAGHGFVIDNQSFDPNRVDQFATLGDVDEWTVRNLDIFAHPFHIHINPYLVTHINGQPFNALSYEDTTIVPPNGGSITFRTRYYFFAGTYVYHCHILGHEDGGMMGVIQVGCSRIDTPTGQPIFHGEPIFSPGGPAFRPSPRIVFPRPTSPFGGRPICQ